MQLKYLEPVYDAAARRSGSWAARRRRPTPSAASISKPAISANAPQMVRASAISNAKREIAGLPQADSDLWELRWLHVAGADRRARGQDRRSAQAASAQFEQMMQRRGKLADDNEIYRYLLGYVGVLRQGLRPRDRRARARATSPIRSSSICSAMAYEAKGDIDQRAAVLPPRRWSLNVAQPAERVRASATHAPSSPGSRRNRAMSRSHRGLHDSVTVPSCRRRIAGFLVHHRQQRRAGDEEHDDEEHGDAARARSCATLTVNTSGPSTVANRSATA